jgi:hypothetical protein
MPIRVRACVMDFKKKQKQNERKLRATDLPSDNRFLKKAKAS